MKEALAANGPVVRIIDSPIPEPNDDQVLIKVVVSGSNPKDWKVPMWMNNELNQGDDMAGIVHKVGANVVEFKPGDRVAAFHEMMAPHGSFADYAVAWAHTTFHLPSQTSFEEGAAIPLAAMTAALGLYSSLGLPQPWTPAKEDIPLIVYGASSAVGAYAVQLAVRSNIHPIIAVAGSSAPYVETLIDRSRSDTIIDYREGHDAIVAGIKKALDGRSATVHVLDAVSEKGSLEVLAQTLPKGAKATFVLPGNDYSAVPDHIVKTTTMVGSVHDKDKDFGHVYFRYIAKGLKDGWFRPQRTEVIPGGLHGVQKGLENLRDGKANAVKYVFRIAETPGVKL